MYKPNMRQRFFKWIRQRVLKLDPGAMLPMWAFWLKCAFFPIWAIRASANEEFYYNPEYDIFTIYGKKYRGTLFRSFADGGISLNKPLQFIDRGDAVTIQTIEGVLMGFRSDYDFRVYMHKTFDGYWHTETFLSPELLAEMKDNAAIRRFIQEEFLVMIGRGIEALKGEA